MDFKSYSYLAFLQFNSKLLEENKSRWKVFEYLNFTQTGISMDNIVKVAKSKMRVVEQSLPGEIKKKMN